MFTKRVLQKAQRPFTGTLHYKLGTGVTPSRLMVTNFKSHQPTMWPMRFKSSTMSETAPETSDNSIASVPKDLFELGKQLERQHEIKENIAKAKRDIIEKQSEGLKLALNVSRDQVGLNEHIEAMDQELVNS